MDKFTETQGVLILTNYQLKCMLSIDSRCIGGDLHKVLERDDFNINTDLNLIRKKKQGDDQKFSTQYTLLALDYDAEDVVNRLKELKVEEHSETKIDKDDVNPPILFVFGKDINGKLIYVKLKIRDQQKQVVCVSFHYAKDKMEFPYA